jgi:hypothetical protein
MVVGQGRLLLERDLGVFTHQHCVEDKVEIMEQEVSGDTDDLVEDHITPSIPSLHRHMIASRL